MTLKVTHAFHTLKSDGPDPAKVQASHWNADHVLIDVSTGQPTTGTLVPVGTIVDYCGHTPPPGWLECGGQLLPYATYPALYSALVKIDADVDITVSSPAVISWTAHGIVPGNTIWFGTSGLLPAPLSPGGKAYVHSSGYTADTFRISGSFEGPTINTTVAGNGTHYGVHAPFGVEGTSFRLPDYREVVPVGHSNLGSLGTTAKLLANYATGEIIGVENATLAMGNMPRHDHGGLTDTENANHTHTVSGSGSGSGATDFRDLPHGHDIAHEYWKTMADAGGHKALQPDDETGADGTFTKATANSAAGALNHQHGFSVNITVTGGTGIESVPHKHPITLQGNNIPFSIVQPTMFVRKIIYAGI